MGVKEEKRLVMQVTESILWELFVQAGPVVSVHMPKDRITGSHQGFGFVEFMGEEDADYAIKVTSFPALLLPCPEERRCRS